MTHSCKAPRCCSPKTPAGLDVQVCPTWFADVVDGTDKFAARVQAIRAAVERWGVETVEDCCKHPAGHLVRALVVEDTELIFATSRGAQPVERPLHDQIESLADGVHERTALLLLALQAPSGCASSGGCGDCRC